MVIFQSIRLVSNLLTTSYFTLWPAMFSPDSFDRSALITIGDFHVTSIKFNTKLLILLIFHFFDLQEQLKTNFYTNFRSEWVLGFVIFRGIWLSQLFVYFKKVLNRQNGFRTTLEWLSCHKDFEITQAQTKVSFLYLNPLLQVEFRAIFGPFS